MIKNNFIGVYLQVSCFDYEDDASMVPGELLFCKKFLNLGQALKFIEKHKSSTFGCYRYTLDIF